MTAERWARVNEVFHAAMERTAQERDVFVVAACGDDEGLRGAVRKLLASAAEPSLASPVEELLDRGPVEIAAGAKLAQYEVEAKIGAGGMGTVYRCHDTRLQRKVALKVLRPDYFGGGDTKERLVQEARAASALTHPNIVTIYEIGSDGDVDFISMEHVEGKRLDELIPEGGMPAQEVIRLAAQAADGLAKAHAAGILHRDLKPSNLMVTGGAGPDEGRVKILDFGLAKVLALPEGAGAAGVSGQSTVAGTVSYMSPEQAEGRTLDARSDVFSFGSVLYEMATGRKPFRADSWDEMLRKIVKETPRPPRELTPMPAELEKTILRCLAKDPAERFASMAELKAALDGMRAGAKGSRRWMVGALIAAGLSVVAAFVWLRGPEEASVGQTVKFTFTPAKLGRGNASDVDAEVSVSPNGKHVTYVEAEGGQLWVRDLSQEEARKVPGATRVYQVFWSPDSRQIGYSAGKELMRIPIEGGTPVRITKLESGFRRAYWSSDSQTIVYCDDTGLYTISASGGTAKRIIAHNHIEHPSFVDLPDGRRAILFQAVYTVGHEIFVQVEGEDQRRPIRQSASTNPYPAYSPSGHIVYVDGVGDASAIWALPFSLRTLQPAGEPFQVAQRGSSPQVSRNGTLVYSDVPSTKLQLVLRDRGGKTLRTIGEPRNLGWVEFSPDGRRIALGVDGQMWVHDIEAGTRKQFTMAEGRVQRAAWQPGGEGVVYSAGGPGKARLYTKALSGGEAASVAAGDGGMELSPEWSADGRYLIYEVVSKESKRDIVYRERLADGSLGAPRVFLKTAFDEGSPRFSPDGRYVVYVSNASGDPSVWVREFPQGREWRLPGRAEGAPRWRKGEIFYGAGTRVMAVAVKTTPAFTHGEAEVVAEARALVRVFDVSADGTKFLVWEKTDTNTPLAIHVVHNWFEEFRARK